MKVVYIPGHGRRRNWGTSIQSGEADVTTRQVDKNGYCHANFNSEHMEQKLTHLPPELELRTGQKPSDSANC